MSGITLKDFGVKATDYAKTFEEVDVDRSSTITAGEAANLPPDLQQVYEMLSARYPRGVPVQDLTQVFFDRIDVGIRVIKDGGRKILTENDKGLFPDSVKDAFDAIIRDMKP